MIALVKELGFDLTEADFVTPTVELGEDELEGVAGGFKRCGCIVGGGGGKNDEGRACVCVVTGFGMRKIDTGLRCICLGAGYGFDSVKDE